MELHIIDTLAPRLKPTLQRQNIGLGKQSLAGCSKARFWRSGPVRGLNVIPFYAEHLGYRPT
jgi:hypothetical protein